MEGGSKTHTHPPTPFLPGPRGAGGTTQGGGPRRGECVPNTGVHKVTSCFPPGRPEPRGRATCDRGRCGVLLSTRSGPPASTLHRASLRPPSSIPASRIPPAPSRILHPNPPRPHLPPLPPESRFPSPAPGLSPLSPAWRWQSSPAGPGLGGRCPPRFPPAAPAAAAGAGRKRLRPEPRSVNGGAGPGGPAAGSAPSSQMMSAGFFLVSPAGCVPGTAARGDALASAPMGGTHTHLHPPGLSFPGRGGIDEHGDEVGGGCPQKRELSILGVTRAPPKAAASGDD